MSMTGRYYLVEKGEIVDGPRHLPKSWRNISGLDKASPAKLYALGWLPEEELNKEYDSDTHKQSQEPSREVIDGKVVTTWVVIDKTAEEIDAEDEARAEKVSERKDVKAVIMAIAKIQEANGRFIVPSDLEAVKAGVKEAVKRGAVGVKR